MTAELTAEQQARVDVKSYIYAMCCPDSGEVRYIGKADNPSKRLATHLRDALRRDYPCSRWLRKLMASGKKPEMIILSEHLGDGWKQAEVEAIAKYRASGARLLNVADGGDQPRATKAQLASNGREVARIIHGDAEKKKLWALKRGAGEQLRWLEKNSTPERVERFKDTMRFAAMMRPSVFGKWAAI